MKAVSATATQHTSDHVTMCPTLCDCGTAQDSWSAHTLDAGLGSPQLLPLIFRVKAARAVAHFKLCQPDLCVRADANAYPVKVVPFGRIKITPLHHGGVNTLALAVI
jgi:hypothetical protein